MRPESWTAVGTFIMAIGTVVIATVTVLAYMKAQEEFGESETPSNGVVAITTSTGSGLRLVCPDGCEEIDAAKANFCMQQARSAGRRGLERRGENVSRALEHWRACVQAEGYSLEACDRREPDCTIEVNPFADLY